MIALHKIPKKCCTQCYITRFKKIFLESLYFSKSDESIWMMHVSTYLDLNRLRGTSGFIRCKDPTNQSYFQLYWMVVLLSSPYIKSYKDVINNKKIKEKRFS